MSKKTNKSNVFSRYMHIYRNKYYNLFRANFKWSGLDYRQEEYIMKQFWYKGTVAAFKIKNIDELAFAPWAMNSWDMYGLPEKVTLINTYSSPLVPTKMQVVDKDVVIGYLQHNKKSLSEIVEWYLERIVDVEMVINTNLQLQKMPFLVTAEDDKDSKKVQDVIDSILDNEEVIKIFGSDTGLIQAIQTGVPYVIDKLSNYRKLLENDLKTIMGIDNKGEEKIEQLQMSEVNANNAEINSHEDSYIDCLTQFCDNIKETLGISISVEAVREEVVADGQYHDYNEQPGPESDEE